MTLKKAPSYLLSLSTALFLQATTPARSQELAASGDTLKARTGISIKSNLLWSAAAEPNLAVEIPVGEHVTVGAAAGIKTWPRWLFWDNDIADNDVHWRNFAVVPQMRYYFSKIYDGWFAGVDFVYTHFNVGNVSFPFGMYPEAKDYRLQGSFWGAGITAGRTWWLGEHWRIEAEAGVAGGLAAYDRYDCAHCGSKLADERKAAVVPKVGISIAYNPVARSQRRSRSNTVYLSGETSPLTLMSPPVAFVVHLAEVASAPTVGDNLAAGSPWILPVGDYRPLDYLTRPGRDSILYVQYPVDSYALDPAFGQNGKALEALTTALKDISADRRTNELLVSVVGLASIEGPRVRNDSLAVRRARSVADYLAQETGLPRRNFEVIGKGEAWDWFSAQLAAGAEGLDSQDVTRLQEILASTNDPDERERKIRSDARLYRQVVDNLLSDQRNAGYIRVYYGTAPDPVAGKMNGEVASLLKAKRYREAVRVLQADPALLERIKTDAEAMNAYGVALYFTALDNHDAAAEAEAIALLKKAAEKGSTCAATNLKGIDTYGPARKEYEAWQQALKEE